MGFLANISGKEASGVFEKFGYSVKHQSGSHLIMAHKEKPTISIPLHKELAPGLLRGLIRKSGISVDDFLENLGRTR